MKKVVKRLLYVAGVLTLLAAGTLVYKKFFAAPLRVTVPSVITINLDLAPEKRWDPVIRSMNKAMITLYDQQLAPAIDKLRAVVGVHGAALAASAILPDEYRRELQGIARSLREHGGPDLKNLTYENLLLLSVAYDVLINCTAGIIVGTAQTPYLFRTLDWQFLVMRKLITTIRWYKGGKHLFTTVGIPFVPVAYTGERTGAFAVAINARHEPSLALGGAIARYVREPINVWSTPVLVRYALQYMSSYHQAYTLFKSAKLIGSVYVILAGTTFKEGVILARDNDQVKLKDKIEEWRYYYPTIGQPVNPANEKSSVIIDPQHAQTRYIVVTNIDNDYPSEMRDWVKQNPLLVEKRRGGIGPRYRRNSALNSCCTLPGDFSADDLFNKVLANPPVRNQFTIHATVMCPQNGMIKSWVIW